MKTYSPCLQRKQHKKQQAVYTSIFLRHSDDITQLQKDMSFGFKNDNHDLYKEPLQCEKLMYVAWLDYSTREMDKDLLAREILLDSGVEVCLSWKKIYLGEKVPMEGKGKLKALHVDINAICPQWNFTILSDKYGRLETSFPGG